MNKALQHMRRYVMNRHGAKLQYPKRTECPAKTRGYVNRRLKTEPVKEGDTHEVSYHFTKGRRTRALRNYAVMQKAERL